MIGAFVASFLSAMLEGVLLKLVIHFVGGPVEHNDYWRAVLVALVLSVVSGVVFSLFGPLGLIAFPVAYIFTLMAAYEMPPASAAIVGIVMAIVKAVLIASAVFFGLTILGFGALLAS